MTYNEKKSLYESIMQDVAKIVKRQINEAGVASLEPVINDRLDVLNSTLVKARREFPEAVPVILNCIDRFEEIVDRKDKRWLIDFGKAINPDWLSGGQKWQKTIDHSAYDDELSKLK